MATTFGTNFICERCAEKHQPEEMSSGMKVCKACVKEQRRNKSLETSKVARRTAFKALVAGIRGNRINVPHTSEVAAEMIKLFGGLEQFCAEWKADLDSLRMEKPGSKAVLDAKSAILKLVVDSTNQRHSAPDLAGLSDEELEKEFAGLAAFLLQKNPDVMVELLETSGKRLVDVTETLVIEDGSVG